MNRLGSATSPYLRQHADNPVDWWEWGEAAWAEARRHRRPVLLSIGYSACHWCHVMAHESFEDPATAALMNELFVCIKVDREERPDVDGVYMQAVQAMTGHGGWPMTVFCTPAAVPYYGGTYFPPEDRHGMPGFPRILQAAAAAWTDHPDDVARTGEQLRQALAPPRLPPAAAPPDAAVIAAAAAVLVRGTDREHGGFGAAPKFPHPGALDLMLRHARVTGDDAARDAALLTLDRMERGGVRDQVGGAFHRYSVDARWAVPHFERMLYDNAQLAPVYLHAFQLTGDPRWAGVVAQVLDATLADLALPGGGIASTLDADSVEGEGAYFTWTRPQLDAVLGPADGAFAARVYGVDAPGHTLEDGGTVLHRPEPDAATARELGVTPGDFAQRLAGVRARLLTARAERPAPGRDDKVITAWNGMMIGALAEAGAALDRPDWIGAAERAAAFCATELGAATGAPRRCWLDGDSRIAGFLEDSAALADGLLHLHAATGDPAHLALARRLCDDMLARFHDPVAGFYDTAVDGEALLVRPQTLDDNAVPAGRSLAALALLRLGALTGERRYLEVARSTIEPLADAVGRSPLGLANLGWATQQLVLGMHEVALVGGGDVSGLTALRDVVQHEWWPLAAVTWTGGMPRRPCHCSPDAPPSPAAPPRTSAARWCARRR